MEYKKVDIGKKIFIFIFILFLNISGKKEFIDFMLILYQFCIFLYEDLTPLSNTLRDYMGFPSGYSEPSLYIILIRVIVRGNVKQRYFTLPYIVLRFVIEEEYSIISLMLLNLLLLSFYLTLKHSVIFMAVSNVLYIVYIKIVTWKRVRIEAPFIEADFPSYSEEKLDMLNNKIDKLIDLMKNDN